MKKLLGAAIVVVTLAFGGAAAHADQYVHGYVKKDGTYVQGHYRSEPNAARNDNYSTRGNINPYTGQSGTKPRDEDRYANPYTRQHSSPYDPD